ncbi:hypothetical protein DFJ74DRAFT_773136 [Hyaloraphidium curvatum]|nr:hypothetical protein DFJ74DRAFT_773136 [Hyaloraphidium curvatum]
MGADGGAARPAGAAPAAPPAPAGAPPTEPRLSGSVTSSRVWDSDSLVSLGEEGPLSREKPPPIAWTARTVAACLGLAPPPGTGTPSPPARRTEWLKAAAATVFFCCLFAACVAVNRRFYAEFEFSGAWLPNGIMIGAVCGLSWRARLLLPPATYLTNFVASYYIGGKAATLAAGLAGVNLLEILLVAHTTLFCASVFSRRPGVPVDLSKAWHVAAFAIGTAFVWPCNALYAQVMLVLRNMQDTTTYQSMFLRWLDIGPVVAFAPFVMTVVRVPPTLRTFTRHPWRTAGSALIVVLLVAVPLLMSLYIHDFIILATIVGLFLSQPLILLAAWITGIRGATFCCMVLGVISITVIPLTNANLTPRPPLNALVDHLVWTQVCVAVSVFTALVFCDMLAAVRRARESIEEQVRVRTAQLREARLAAERADRDKANFIGFLCHELRNPLHAVSNLADTLMEERAALLPVRPASSLPLESPTGFPRDVDASELVARTDEDADPLRAIHLCTTYMLALLSDVLDAGRFESGAVKLESLPVDLRALLETVATMAGETSRTQGIRFSFSVAPDVPSHVLCDPLRLQQVVNNLLSNGFKFTKPGGSVSLTVARQPMPPRKPPSDSTLVAVDEPPRDCLRISCRDTGIGIRPDVLGTLFQPWTQASASTARDYGGSGLGLAIAAQIVALMGGEIGAESEVGVGTEFAFWIPLRECAEPEPADGEREMVAAPEMVQLARAEPGPGEAPVSAVAAAAEPEPATPEDDADAPPPRVRRILVTDDSAINRRILVRMLRSILDRRGARVDEWRVDEAENGREAVDAVRRDAEGGREYALLLMDIVMPVMDGYAATREIRGLLAEGSARLPAASNAPSAGTLVGPGGKAYHEMPVVITTANQVGAGPEQEWARCGADGAISKPFGKERIEGLLAEYGCIT